MYYELRQVNETEFTLIEAYTLEDAVIKYVDNQEASFAELLRGGCSCYLVYKRPDNVATSIKLSSTDDRFLIVDKQETIYALKQSSNSDAIHYFNELMAVMHGDGGHYLAKHGAKKAYEDALKNYYQLLQTINISDLLAAIHNDGGH